jgi:hypothetical protein
MAKHQFHDLGHLLPSLIPLKGYFPNYSWYCYLDKHRHLKVSIVRLFQSRLDFLNVNVPGITN